MKEHKVKTKRVFEDDANPYQLRRYVVDTDSETERVWQDYWEPLLAKGGQLDLLALKKELCDYFFLIDYARQLNFLLTGGKLKHAFYPLPVAMGIIQARLDERVEEEVAEELKCHRINFLSKH